MARDFKGEYAEKLRDPRWQRKRLEVLQRDDWTCQRCWSKDRTLNVHHKTYLRGHEPWEYDAALLLTLCEDCHPIQQVDNKEALEEFLTAFYTTVKDAVYLKALASICTSAGEYSASEIICDVDWLIRFAPSFFADFKAGLECLGHGAVPTEGIEPVVVWQYPDGKTLSLKDLRERYEAWRAARKAS